MALKDRLKTLRIKADLSQRELADRLHFSSGSIGNYESGLRVPTEDALNTLAEFFNVPVADLAFGPQLTPTQYQMFCDLISDALAHTSSDDLAVLRINEYYIRLAMRRRDPIREDRARDLAECLGTNIDGIMAIKEDHLFEAPTSELDELFALAREASDEQIRQTRLYLEFLRRQSREDNKD